MGFRLTKQKPRIGGEALGGVQRNLVETQKIRSFEVEREREREREMEDGCGGNMRARNVGQVF